MGENGHGFITISREDFEGDPLWLERRVFSRWEAMVDLIQQAAWGERQVLVGSTMVTLQRGEFLASLRYLARRWNWSRPRVSRFLALETGIETLARQRRTSEGDIYLLVNYESYQGSRDSGVTRRDAGSETAACQRRRRSGSGSESSLTSAVSLDLFPTDTSVGPRRADGVVRLEAQQVKAVFARHCAARVKFFELKNGRPPSSAPDLTKPLAKLIREAIRAHGYDKALAAGVGIFYSPHHTGENDRGTEYLDPAICWRIKGDLNNVERFSDLYFGRDPRGERLHLLPLAGVLGAQRVALEAEPGLAGAPADGDRVPTLQALPAGLRGVGEGEGGGEGAGAEAEQGRAGDAAPAVLRRR